MGMARKNLIPLIGLILCAATGLISAAEKSKAELELDRRAKKEREEHARQEHAAEFQALVAEAVKKGAKEFDWSLVPVRESRDWPQQQAVLLARYKDSTVIIEGVLGSVFNRGTPQANFIMGNPFRSSGKLLVLLRDLDDQKILDPTVKQLHIKVVGTIRDNSLGNLAAIVDAEAVGLAK